MKNPIKSIRKKICEKRFDNGRYNPEKISRIKKAKAMDLVLELCLKHYVGKENEIDFFKLEKELNEKLCFHSYESEFIMRIMIASGYIKEKSDENGIIKQLYSDTKGFQLFLDGGFLPEAKKKRNTERLIKIGQYSAVLGGTYYLIRILKEILPKILEIVYPS